MRLGDYDQAVCLCVDHRFKKSWPRIERTFGDRVNHLRAYINGEGKVFPPRWYDRTWERPPAHWPHGAGAWQHFRCMQAVVRRARDDGLRNLLWIEDDCVLADDFDAVVEAAADWPGTPDLVYYGANHANARTVDVAPHLMRVWGSLTTHLVGIRRSAFDPILELPPEHVIDRLIADRLHPALDCVAVWPSVATQLPGYSYLWHRDTDYTPLWANQGLNR